MAYQDELLSDPSAEMSRRRQQSPVTSIPTGAAFVSPIAGRAGKQAPALVGTKWLPEQGQGGMTAEQLINAGGAAAPEKTTASATQNAVNAASPTPTSVSMTPPAMGGSSMAGPVDESGFSGSTLTPMRRGIGAGEGQGTPADIAGLGRFESAMSNMGQPTSVAARVAPDLGGGVTPQRPGANTVSLGMASGLGGDLHAARMAALGRGESAGGGGGGYGDERMPDPIQAVDTSHRFDRDIAMAGSSSDVFDQWKARRMSKIRDMEVGRTLEGAKEGTAQYQARTAQQQVGQAIPLERMRQAGQLYGHDVQRRGQDISAAVQSRGQDVQRYGQELNAQSARQGHDVQRYGMELTSDAAQAAEAGRRYGHELNYAPQAGMARINAMKANAIQAGEYGTAETITRSTSPNYPPAEKPPVVKYNPMTGEKTIVGPEGVQDMSLAEQKAAALKRQRDAAAANYGKQ